MGGRARWWLLAAGLVAGLVARGGGAAAVNAADELAAGFGAPPASARPWVYLFPLDGNLSRGGITADLEAMARAGVGGLLYMETDQGAPPGPAKFGEPLWCELFHHLCTEAQRLGLQVNMNNDAGWCGSGGPWITPELSMQRVVWTETAVKGPAHYDAPLPQAKAVKDFYRDIAVLAFPTPVQKFQIPQFRGKSAATRDEIALRAEYPTLPAAAVVDRSQVVDLTEKLAADGRLTWDVPPGQWTILRLGHTSTGKDNHPAPLAGRGLECDKLSREATEAHFNGLMGRLIAQNQGLVGQQKTLVSTHIDSWEVGSQNWTPKFREEFRRLRGYDLWTWLPAMAGYVVDSAAASERFLWDIRQTVNDLLCANYAGHMRQLAHRHGMRLSIEAYDTPPCNDLTYAGQADEPMAEFWSWGINEEPIFAAYSCTEMASAAHVYGRPILGAEAFTATDKEKWLGHPAVIKGLGDWAFCEGVNRFVFHRYAAQPWTNPDRAPGMSMGPWGLHYERSQTWWEQSRAWHTYLARCQYLLQQGLFVADLCFLAPESSPQRFKSPVKSGYERPGYNFDACPAEVVLTRMQVRDGRLVLPDGMNYRVLVLPQVATMTPELLRKIRDLVQQGATIIGGPVRKSPSLRDYPRCDAEVQALARELWGDSPQPTGPEGRAVGKGRVIWTAELTTRPHAPYENSPAFSRAKWIWFPEGRPERSAPPGRRFFQRIVEVDSTSPVASARLVLTADNTFECWVNGQPAGKGHDFHRGYPLEVGPLLKPGANLVAVLAVNTLNTPNPAGLVGALSIRYRDGRMQEIISDAAWRTSQTAPDGWNADAAPGAAWAAAQELGPLGMAPWGEVVEGSPLVDEIPDMAVIGRVLEQRALPPDFAATPGLRYIHKRIGLTDCYFVSNPQPSAVEARCTFRCKSPEIELWWPDTGRRQPTNAWKEEGRCTSLTLRLEPYGSVFVMFRPGDSQTGKRKTDGGPTGGKNWLEFTQAQELAGPWQVQFDPRWGGPVAAVTFERLDDWSQRPEPGIKYYSGTARYRRTFRCEPALARKPLWINLGKVAVMAQVKLNGRDLGIAWKPPYRLDTAGALKPGDNVLEIDAVNLWINRQIGDEQLPDDSDRNPNGTLKSWPKWLEEGKPSPTGRYTFGSWRLWKKDDPLVESGLLGPVVLEVAE